MTPPEGPLGEGAARPAAANARDIKILYLIPSLEIGGAETDLVRILPRLDRSRYECQVWPFSARGPLADQLESSGIRIWAPIFADDADPTPATRGPADPIDPIGRLRRLCSSIRSAGRLTTAIARRVRAADIDIVHAILPSAYVLGALSGLLTPRRLVMSRLSQNWYHQQSPLFGRVERQFAHRRVQIAIANSNVLLDELRAEGLPERKLRLVYNGIDAETARRKLIGQADARRRLALADTSLVISVVANLYPHKGIADLLNALATARDALPADWCLLVAGRDVAGQLNILTTLARQLGLSGNVRFLGQRRDVPTILSAADIHVSASHTEGFPNNILEAMCAALPIVATNVGGIGEQIEHGTSGILTRPRDVPELAAGIAALARDRDLRQRLGHAAAARVRLFSIERACDRIASIYDEVHAAGSSLPGAERT